MASVILVSMAVLPLAESVSRTVFKTGIPGSGPFEQHLTLWIAFLGAALAAREGRPRVSFYLKDGGAKQRESSPVLWPRLLRRCCAEPRLIWSSSSDPPGPK